MYVCTLIIYICLYLYPYVCTIQGYYLMVENNSVSYLVSIPARVAYCVSMATQVSRRASASPITYIYPTFSQQKEQAKPLFSNLASLKTL